MTTLDSDVWTRLALENPSGDVLVARPGVSAGSKRLLAALDSFGLRHLLVRIDSEAESLPDTQLRGLLIRTRSYAVRDSERNTYIDLVCRDVQGHQAFDLLGAELDGALQLAALAPGRTVATVVARWKRFWSEVSAGTLSREAQVGLFGELWFLSVWLLEVIPPHEAAQAWRGPLGARNDFERKSWSIEAKTTTNVSRRVHVISGLDQLAPPENGKLYFFSLQVREEGGATNTLPLLVDACRKELNAEVDALTRFETTLAQAGYADSHRREYSDLKLRVWSEKLFAVDGRFPRLSTDLFQGGLPAGVGKITYEIDLAPVEHAALATSPQSGQPLLCD